MKPWNRAAEGRFLVAMQHDAHNHRPLGRKPRGGKAGWIAFTLGMAAMFVVMAIWVALVETGENPSDEVQFIARSDAIDQRSDAGARRRAD